jgi:hypothetical protein
MRRRTGRELLARPDPGHDGNYYLVLLRGPPDIFGTFTRLFR